MNFMNILIGGCVVGQGLYVAAKTFFPELRSKGDNFIRSTTDQDTRFRLNVFGYEKAFGKDKRQWKVWGKMVPAGYFVQGMTLVVCGLFVMLWDLIEGAGLQSYAFAVLAAVILGSIVASFNLREPLEPSDLPKDRIGDPMDEPTETNADDFNRTL
jgi:hypothetical protein